MKVAGILLIVLWPWTLLAQHNDFGHWYEVQVSTKLAKGLKASAELANRFMGPGSQLDNTYFEIGLTRKVNDLLRAEFAWRYAGRENSEEGLDLTHRWAFGFRLKESIGDVDFSWRSRYQFRPYGLIEDSGISLNSTWRNRLRGEFKVIKRTWLNADLEVFASSSDAGLTMTDWRTRLRIKRKIDKRLYASIGGLYQREVNSKDPNAEWVLQVSVQWEWKRKKKGASKS